ncbi:MAG: nuclear transport factor 2 family protein [Thermotogota bacterium]
MRRKRDADEKAVIADVIRRSVAWGLTKDVEMQTGTLAHDDDLFIIWTASWHVTSGWGEHEKHLETVLDPRFKAERAEVRDLQIHLARSGDVAWYSATLDDMVSWDGKTDRFGEGLRWTGVLEKRDGRWVIVQMHASLPVDKAREIVMRDVAAHT